MEKTRLDDLDMNILRTLQENPKMRIRDLAEKLSVPKSTIYYRLRELEKADVIEGYRMFGDVDFIIVGKFPCKEKYMEFLEELINSSFIERSSTIVVAKVIKEDFHLNI